MPPMSTKHPTWVERHGNAQEFYALLTPTGFRLPSNPGPNVVYVEAIVNPGNVQDPAPLLVQNRQ
jgi:hypothetical protein